MDTALPDGERILTWEQVYALDRAARAAGRGRAPGSPARSSRAPTRRSAREVVLVSSREHVLPGEDPDAAQVLEDVFERRGMTVLRRSPGRVRRPDRRRGAGHAADGRTVRARTA